MKKPLLAWCLAAMVLILCGCQGRGMAGAAGVGGQVVTGISVTCQTCESFERREYSAPEKLRLLWAHGYEMAMSRMDELREFWKK